jgi:hypothetical protein
MRFRNIFSGLALIGTIVLLAGCGGASSSSGVTPTAYVKSICSAIGPFEKDVESRSGALNVATIQSATQGKTALIGFLNAIAADSHTALSQLKSAGAPNVSGGRKIASAVVSAFGQLDTALGKAATQAKALPTSTPAAFKSAANSLSTSVKNSVSGIGASLGGLKSPTLQKAASKEPACKGV